VILDFVIPRGVSGADSRVDLFLPPAPTGLGVVSGDEQVTVSWVAPTVLAQTPITDYAIEYRLDSDTGWTPFTDSVSAALNTTVTGLTNGDTYRFRVAAINGIGQGAWSAISPLGSPDTIVTDLLLHLDSTFNDSGSYSRTVTSSGSVSISSAQSKFGGASALFSGGRLDVTLDPDFTGDWTVEAWLYLNSVSSASQTIFGNVAPATGGLHIHLAYNQLAVNNGLAAALSGGTFVTGAWTHIAVVRNAGVISAYQNGTLIGTTSQTPSVTSSTFNIGNSVGGSYNFPVDGYIDELRVLKGIVAYPTAPFTPPTAPF
jgi:hypothetical protein